ncbi:XAC2610-related protein [Xanthocytophaga agilis]|uniref:Lipoprotein n=1 Tax=Xanthocytophaga agilis TaxID=3048010 RepID=A0AAE3R2W3_9BACT|nr:hypothetical protein [Xanthocytophaga agilis]MDJ1502671.1 hypothetical protein [Xanthocytophaga agilis]
MKFMLISYIIIAFLTACGSSFKEKPVEKYRPSTREYKSKLFVKDRAIMNAQDFLRGDSILISRLKGYTTTSFVEINSSSFYLKIFKHPQINKPIAVLIDFDHDIMGFYISHHKKWHSMNIYESSFGKTFSVFTRLSDFNFDNYTDLALHTSSSNGCSSAHFAFYFYDPKQHIFINDTTFEKSVRGNPIADKNHLIIRSREASCACGCYTIYEHKWTDNKLRLVRTLNKDPYADTLFITNYSTTGQILSKSEEYMSYAKSQKLISDFENYKKYDVR